MGDSSKHIPTLTEIVTWEKWTQLTPGKLGNILLGWIYIRIVLDIFVCFLQVHKDWHETEIPSTFRDQGVSQERFNQSRSYRLHKHYAKIGSYLYILMVVHYIYIGKGTLYLLWNWSGDILTAIGLWPTVWDPELGWTTIFIIISTLFFNAFDIPIRAFDAFVVEEYHGLNHQTLTFFIKDELKLNAVEIIIGVPVGVTVVYIVKVSPNFYWYLWIVSVAVLAFFLIIYPRWVVPLLNEHVPLPDGSTLRRNIAQLAEKCGFPLEDVDIVLESQRTTHAFITIQGSSRIVLSDNILRTYLREHPNENVLMESWTNLQADNIVHGGGCTEEEIVALVAHELGHWKASQFWWNVVLAFLNLFCFFGTFSAYYKQSVMYEVFQFPKKYKKPILIGLFIIFNHILDTVNFITDLALRKVARVRILSADRFAVKLGYGDPLKRAILKTNIDDLNIGAFDPIYTCYFLDRPTLNKRLKSIEDEMHKRQ